MKSLIIILSLLTLTITMACADEELLFNRIQIQLPRNIKRLDQQVGYAPYWFKKNSLWIAASHSKYSFLPDPRKDKNYKKKEFVKDGKPAILITIINSEGEESSGIPTKFRAIISFPDKTDPNTPYQLEAFADSQKNIQPALDAFKTI